MIKFDSKIKYVIFPFAIHSSASYTYFFFKGFISNLTSISSMLLVVLMCAERFVALRFPFKYDSYFTIRKASLTVGFMLLYSVSRKQSPHLDV